MMTVQPGFGGQPFREDMLPKITEVAQMRQDRGLNFRIEVDGGVDLVTAPECRKAGADAFVVGRGVFKAQDKAAVAKAIQAL